MIESKRGLALSVSRISLLYLHKESEGESLFGLRERF